jgi:FkbM family methyltransferase
MIRGAPLSPSQTISYAQRYEDMRLLCCFEGQATGFYIDIGAGHPVYDNMSFAFYLRGWRGVTVEPNPWLALLSEAVRSHDTRIASLVGATEGEATYYLVEDLHGLSTTFESHARAAEREHGKRAQALTMPVTTLQMLCERYSAGAIDFLKVDVEGAERAVIEGGDWRRFRPKMLVLEALAPVTLAPSWQGWASLLDGHGYRFAYFDGLNAYYAAEEHGGLIGHFLQGPDSFAGVTQFSVFKAAADDPSHPDHGLARLLAGADPVRLPLLPPGDIAELLIAGLEPAALDRPAWPRDIIDLHRRLFGTNPQSGFAANLAAPPNATIRDLYRRVIATEPFRAACGRISASSAW